MSPRSARVARPEALRRAWLNSVALHHAHRYALGVPPDPHLLFFVGVTDSFHTDRLVEGEFDLHQDGVGSEVSHEPG